MPQPKGKDWLNAYENTATTAKSHQSCPTLCDPVDGSLPGSSVLRGVKNPFFGNSQKYGSS